MYDEVIRRFDAPAVDFWSLRISEELTERIEVRKGVQEPVHLGRDFGAMVTVWHEGGIGHAGTSDLSASGLKAAADRARAWATATKGRLVFDTDKLARADGVGEYAHRAEEPWDEVALGEKIDALKEATRFELGPRIVDKSAAFWFTRARSRFVTGAGGDVTQSFDLLAPRLEIVANEGSETQIRTLSSEGRCQQGGFELVDKMGFRDAGKVVAEEALELLSAPNCPTGTMDLILAPDQMMLQIHESIGHPLELDRILGDERNYAGRSFVSLDMFGAFQYGSELLNVTYDPGPREEFASYGWDDDGSAAERVFLIKDGRLLAPIGGAISRSRAKRSASTASSRACSWNRPPIDRMSNLNVEPGDKSFDDLVALVDNGVLMETNRSWSIDDSRNKFQFGCQRGRLIENGELKGVVKNPSYRGVSRSFWRALKGVGDRSTWEVHGEPYCGKGEPNQIIRVGHASPMCLFGDVSVFGPDGGDA